MLAQSNVLSVAPPEKATGKQNGTLSAKVHVQLRNGYHVNSNTPADEYIIPLRLTWNAGPLQVLEVVYPKPEMEKYAFSEKPVSVFSGAFDIVTKFKAPASAPLGMATLTGKLRYQACNNTMCLPPKTVEVQLPVDVVK